MIIRIIEHKPDCAEISGKEIAAYRISRGPRVPVLKYRLPGEFGWTALTVSEGVVVQVLTNDGTAIDVVDWTWIA